MSAYLFLKEIRVYLRDTAANVGNFGGGKMFEFNRQSLLPRQCSTGLREGRPAAIPVGGAAGI